MTIIDVHAHAYCAESEAFMAARGARRLMVGSANAPARKPTAPGYDDDASIEARLALMDEAGVSMQVLSPTLPPYLENEAEAIEVARLINGRNAALVRRYPGRFAFFAALPLPHIEASLRELGRCLDDLGAVGAIMFCSCLGRSAADAAFDPLFAAIHERRTLLFLHPSGGGIGSPYINDWRLGACIGPTFEDAVVALHLIGRQIPQRFPDMKVMIPHLGGVLPMLLARLDNQMPVAIPELTEKPSQTARRFWYDSASHGSVAGLRCAVEAFGAERIVSGSDFPILTEFESYGRTFEYIGEAGLDADVLGRILHGNARTLLGRLDM